MPSLLSAAAGAGKLAKVQHLIAIRDFSVVKIDYLLLFMHPLYCFNRVSFVLF
jgi:hypothetical protein